MTPRSVSSWRYLLLYYFRRCRIPQRRAYPEHGKHPCSFETENRDHATLPVRRSTSSITALDEFPINGETKSRFNPSCAPSRGKMKSSPIRIGKPKGSRREREYPSGPGSALTAILPPSSGGSGNKLKIARTTLITTAFLRFWLAHSPAMSGR